MNGIATSTPKNFCAAHDIRFLRASHDEFQLDSGFRRNDIGRVNAVRRALGPSIEGCVDKRPASITRSINK